MTAPRRSSTDESVYAAVRHADVIELPIGLDRLHRSVIGRALSLLETSMAVDNLVEARRVARVDDLVHLSGREELVERHDEREARAERLWPAAERWGNAVGRVPLVRMVAVIGGLALDSVGPDEGVEFFVVVRPRRLWLARRMVLLLARLASRRGIDLRLAYIVTTRSMEIPERSLHVAHELANMVPVVGSAVCRTVRRSNSWMFDYLPNATIEGDESRSSDDGPTSVQKWVEWFLLLPFFRPLENRERVRCVRRFSAAASARAGEDPPAEAWFSKEVCAVPLMARAAEIDRAWERRTSGD